MSSEFTPITEAELKIMKEMANLAATSSFFQDIGSVGAIFSIMMYARGLKLDPWQCLFGGMKCVMGRIEISPVMMNAMMRKAGHRVEILESDHTICRLKGTRGDTGDTAEVSFSVEDAHKAGIYKATWKNYPSDMCWARAISKLCRRLCPDVIGASYVDGEISGTPNSQQDNESEETKEEAKVKEVEQLPTEPVQPLREEELDEMVSIIAQSVDVSDTSRLRAYVLHCQKTYLEKNIDPRILPEKIMADQQKFCKMYEVWLAKQVA